MLYTLRDLADTIGRNRVKIGKNWLPARPMVKGESWTKRIKAAWLVLIGKADAVRWPGGQ